MEVVVFWGNGCQYQHPGLYLCSQLTQNNSWTGTNLLDLKILEALPCSLWNSQCLPESTHLLAQQGLHLVFQSYPPLWRDMATYSFTPLHMVSTTKTFLDSVWIRWPLWKVTAHSTSQGSQPTIASIITEYFKKKEPFIYEKPNLFAPLWETCLPLTISTQDVKHRKQDLSNMEHSYTYEDLWKRFLVDILVLLFQGKLPFHELAQSAQVIYTTRQCDLDFLGIQRQVVDQR